MKRASQIDISQIDTQSVEFQNALRILSYTSQSIFLTGKAGTGKSTFLQYLIHTTKKKFVVLAPTGIAAVNAGGQTIHSFFKLPFKPLMPDDPDFASSYRMRERLKYPKVFVKLLKQLDLIIIDEVSMVRADVIDFIDRILRVYCGKPRTPFAGKQLLLVGDVFQLEPVVTGDMRDVLSHYYKEGTFFFNAHAFAEVGVVPIELTKVYRQKDASFISLLDRVRVGAPTMADINMLNRKVEPVKALISDDFTMTIATRRDIVDRINQDGLSRLTGSVFIAEGTITGDFPDSSLPTDKTLELKVGAQVVFVKNDMERRWVNGSIGIIDEINPDQIVVEMEDGVKHEVEVEVWENIKYEYDEEKKKVNEKVIGTFAQYPVKLAWALTIHKSQGLTFDRVIIDVGQGAFSGGQTYVALSRCRSLDGIKLRSTINQRDIFVNQRVLNFANNFNNDHLINSALEYAKADDLYTKAAKQFDEGEYSEAVRLFAEAVTARNMLHRDDVVRLLSMKLSRLSALERQVAELKDEITGYRQRNAALASEYVQMGDEVLKEGWDIEPAISNFDKALSLDPDNAKAWTGKGYALGQINDLDGAIDCLIKAAALDVTDYLPLYHAGCLMLSSGDVALGIEYLQQADERNHNVAQVHESLADAYEKAGDDASAARHRRIAQKLRSKKSKKR